MSQPNLLKLRAELVVDQMRAYVMEAFRPEQVEGIVEDALARAFHALPASIQGDVDEAVREAVRRIVKQAASNYGMEERLAKAIRPALLRAIGNEYLEAADRAAREAPPHE
jgi:hypothetical protein